MYTRIAQCTVQTGKFDEVGRILKNDIYPELSRQPGFVDMIALHGDNDPTRLVSITLWKSKEDAEKYGRDVYSRMTGKVAALTSNWTVSGYHVELSTPHRVGAVRAA